MGQHKAMRALFLALVLAAASAMPEKACKPQSSPFPISCIDCKGKVVPQNVPFHNISKLWGVWYTVGSEKNVAIPDSSCIQVNLHAHETTNPTTKLDYEGFFCKGQPSNSTTTCTTAVGDITPTSGSFSPDHPPYQLRIVEQVPFTTDFYFAVTDGDASGDGITAMVTLSCPHATQAFSGSQAFILSRTPQISTETMATLMARAKAAIPNFSEHAFHAPVQNKDQCHYKWATKQSLNKEVMKLGQCNSGKFSPPVTDKCSPYHFTDNGECLQFGIGDACIPFLKKTGKYAAGTCAGAGYTVAAGSKVADLPLGYACGRGTQLSLFTKPALNEGPLVKEVSLSTKGSRACFYSPEDKCDAVAGCTWCYSGIIDQAGCFTLADAGKLPGGRGWDCDKSDKLQVMKLGQCNSGKFSPPVTDK